MSDTKPDAAQRVAQRVANRCEKAWHANSRKPSWEDVVRYVREELAREPAPHRCGCPHTEACELPPEPSEWEREAVELLRRWIERHHSVTPLSNTMEFLDCYDAAHAPPEPEWDAAQFMDDCGRMTEREKIDAAYHLGRERAERQREGVE